jgi:hypothetical protein
MSQIHDQDAARGSSEQPPAPQGAPSIDDQGQQREPARTLIFSATASEVTAIRDGLGALHPNEAHLAAIASRAAAKVEAAWAAGPRDGIAAALLEILEGFEVRMSSDEVKRDHELTCPACQKLICDIEAGDTLGILARTALDHRCGDEEPPEEDKPEGYEHYTAAGAEADVTGYQPGRSRKTGT